MALAGPSLFTWLLMTSVYSQVQAAAVPASIQDVKTRATSGKRGLAYDDGTLANVFAGNSQITWGYNWGYPSKGLSR